MTIASRNSIVSCIILALCPWGIQSVDVSLLDTAGSITGSAGSDGSLAPTVATPPAPQKCWLEALKIFQPTNKYDIQTTTKVCEEMTPIQQKALAFELARCHLQDLGRKMVATAVGEHIDDLQDCVALEDDTAIDDDAGKDSQFPNLPQCLSSLTDSGANAYTTFLAQVVSLCNRLTQYMLISFQQHTALELAKISHETIELFTSTIQRQQEAFYKREEEMRIRHEATRRKDEASRMEAFKTWSAGLLNSWKLRDDEQAEKQNAWLQNLTKVWEEKTFEIEQLYLKKLAAANNFIQPLFSFEKMLLVAAQAYRMLAITVHGLCFLVLAWFLTRPPCGRRVRGALFSLVMMETVAEVCVHFLISDLVSEDQKKAMVSSLRHTAFFVEALTYCAGLVLSCCWCPFGGGTEDDLYDEYDEVEEGEDTESRSENHREELGHQPQTERRRMDPNPLRAHANLNSHSRTLATTGTSSQATLGLTVASSNAMRSEAIASKAAEGPRDTGSATTSVQVTRAAVGSSQNGVVNVAFSDGGSLAASNVSVADEVAENHGTVSGEAQNSQALAPVTRLLQDEGPNGKASTSAEWAKKRSADQLHPNNNSESEESVVDDEASNVGPSPSKRRREEIVEEITVETDEMEYHTAAEEEDHSTEDEDSIMDDDDEAEHMEGTMDD